MKSEGIEWNLGLLYKSDDDPKMKKDREDIEKRVSTFVSKWKNNSEYLKDPKVLTEALEEYEHLQFANSGSDGVGANESYYFWLKVQKDQNNPELKARLNKAEEFVKKRLNELRFFMHNLAKIDEKKQKEFLAFEGLKKYRHVLEKLFRESRYLLGEGEERVLSLKSGPAYENWTRMVSGFLAREEREILAGGKGREKRNFSEISSLLNNQNKKVRDDSAEAFNDILEKNVDAAEAEMNSILMDKKIDDELRGMNRPDLARHISDDIDSEAVDTLIDAVSGRFEIAKRYYRLKAKLMGVKQMGYHERNVPYGEIDTKYPYNEAVKLVSEVFKNLDGEFASIFENFREHGQIDVLSKKGKRSGAFCTDSLINQPTYIMLNHTGELNDVLTLAHELGHGINAELMREKRHPLDYGMVLSTAEVASTFMEDFVLQELEREADEETRLALMMMKLNDDVSTIFRQAACYKFEQELHKSFREKGYLSKAEIGKIFQKHMAAYMGGGVEMSARSENWWVYWSHIRTFFYVYSYASGLLISKALQSGVKRDRKFIEKVKEFLASGMSDSPKNIFMKMGIDITKKEFWNKGLDEIEALLNETEALAKKLGKI